MNGKFTVDNTVFEFNSRYEELEKQRHERKLQFRLELQKLESERRREERRHELHILQILMQTRGQNSVAPFAMTQHYGNYENTTSPNASFSSEKDQSFFQLYRVAGEVVL